jgi:Flp pilus assembly protein TadB
MNTMVLLLGAGCGVGLVLIVSGLVPARPSLATTLASLHQAPRPEASPSSTRQRLLAAPLRGLGLPRVRTRADLAVLERPVAAHLADQTLAVLAGLIGPPLAVAVLGHTGPVVPLWASLAGAVGGWWLAETTVHAEAERRRAELRYTLSAVLDLVVISLAGGAGLEQAVDDACDDTSGWAAARLNRAIATARLLRVPPWHTLGQLGEQTGVLELEELAATMSLAGAEGARIRDALTARADSLRAHQGTALEAKANAATVRMTLPSVLLAIGYMAFLLYPVIATISLH